MNPFKQKIWSDFWENNTETDTEVLIELLIKEAIEKLPQAKLTPADKLKIKRVTLDFTQGKTLTQLNDCTNIIDIGPINNMTCFATLRNIETMAISYFNPRASLSDNDELMLEKSLKQTNLFKSFSKLKKVELAEQCRNGTRRVDVKRRDVLPF